MYLEMERLIADARPVSRHDRAEYHSRGFREIFSRRQQLTTAKPLPFIRTIKHEYPQHENLKPLSPDNGCQKLAQAAAPDGKPVRLTHMAVGDGGGNIAHNQTCKQTRLVHEVATYC